MGIEMDKLAVEGNLLSRLQNLENRIRTLEARGVSVSSIDELGDNLGVMRSGAFIAGTGDPSNSADPFTGVAMLSPGIDPTGSGTEYNFVGMNNGVLQAGISAADGKFYAGGGEVVLDAAGISLNLQSTTGVGASTLKWTDGSNVPISMMGVSQPGTSEQILIQANTIDAAQAAGISLHAYQTQHSIAASIDISALPTGSSMTIGAERIWLVGNEVYISGAPGSLTLNEQSIDGLLHGGWINDAANAFPGQWTYVSATQMHIGGFVNYTDRYTKGTRVRLVNGTTKYLVVASSVYDVGGFTTVTFIPSTSYALTNTAISSIYYSYSATPTGWPGWFQYTPTLTGFSVAPTGTASYWNAMGSTMFINHYETGTGTSNATSFNVSLPVTASLLGRVYFKLLYSADNGANVADAMGVITSGGTNAVLYKDNAGSLWTASGAKRANFQTCFGW